MNKVYHLLNNGNIFSYAKFLELSGIAYGAYVTSLFYIVLTYHVSNLPIHLLVLIQLEVKYVVLSSTNTCFILISSKNLLEL